MDNTELSGQETKSLSAKIWKMANALRSNMDANEFKDYILGVVFYRYICDHEENKFKKYLGISVEDMYKRDSTRCKNNAIVNFGLGYFIQPKYLFKNLVKDIQSGKFSIEEFSKALKAYSDSTRGQASYDQLSGLFAGVNLSSEKLGKDYTTKGEILSKLILAVDEIPFDFTKSKIDVIGNTYEELIGKFAASAGKKGGEFYTPQEVSELLARIVTNDLTKVKYISDPTCGSGSLLIQVAKRITEKGGKYSHIYGQEKNSTTCNLARMNMIMHNVSFNKFTIYEGDTLKAPSDDQREYGKMDIVVANPPFGSKWDANSIMEKDDRFAPAGKLPPRSRADYAFVEHMIHSLSQTGRMAVVLPHGVLFRGGAEDVIRRYLVETRNYLDTVIGLPANLFHGTSIPTCICVFKKDKENRDVYFIDASKNFEKAKNKNILRNEDIDKIVDAYVSKKEIPKFAHLATIDKLREHDFNLNIPRYVDTFEEEEPIDIKAVMKDIEELEKKKSELDKTIKGYLKELGIVKEDNDKRN